MVLPDETDEVLVLESVTLDDAGVYTATQISDGKAELISASFYLNVYEAMPLKWWAVLAIIVLILSSVGYLNTRIKSKKTRL